MTLLNAQLLKHLTVDELLELEQTVLAIKADLGEVADQPATSGEPGEGGSGPVSTIIVGSPSVRTAAVTVVSSARRAAGVGCSPIPAAT